MAGRLPQNVESSRATLAHIEGLTASYHRAGQSGGHVSVELSCWVLVRKVGYERQHIGVRLYCPKHQVLLTTT